MVSNKLDIARGTNANKYNLRFPKYNLEYIFTIKSHSNKGTYCIN